MQRYMVYLHNTSFSKKDAAVLLAQAQRLVTDSAIVRDTRVSKKFLEFDISSDSERIDGIIKKLEAISPMSEYESITERHFEKEEAIKNAIQYFNDEKYWNAHEVLEGIWKNSQGKEKDLLNGIILVAAAFVHDEKDESDVSVSILKRAMTKLSGSAGIYYGMDVDRIKKLVTGIIASERVERFTI